MFVNKKIIFFSIYIFSFLLMLTSFVYSQENGNIRLKVGLLATNTYDEELNIVSSKIEYIINHYFNNSTKKIQAISLTKKYENYFNEEFEKISIDIFSNIAIKENIDAIIIINVTKTFDETITNIIIIKPYKKYEERVTYNKLFHVDLEGDKNTIPFEEIITEIPSIISAVLLVNISISTNVEKVEIYINNKFVSFAEPISNFKINVGKYDLKIVANGYKTLKIKLSFKKDEDLYFLLERSFYELEGLALCGMFLCFESMFSNDKEIMGLSTSYSLLYYFSILGHGKFFLDFNLTILNVTRINTAQFLGNAFNTEIEVNSIVFFGNLRYEPIFDVFPYLSPIIGGGIGLTVNTTNPRSTRILDISYDLICGLSININRTFSIIIEYKYIWLGHISLIELVEIYPGGGLKVNTINQLYHGSVIFIGLRYNL